MDGMKQPSGAIATLSTKATSSPNALQIREENNTRKTINRISRSGPHSTSKKSGVAVAFSPKVRVVIIPSHHDMTEDAKRKIWRTSEEAGANDAETVKIIRTSRSGQMPMSNEDANFCTRGLENLLTQRAARRLRTRRMGLIKAILDAQEREWQEGSLHANPELLRNISTRFSEEDINIAVMRGAADEAYVRGLRRLEAKAA